MATAKTTTANPTHREVWDILRALDREAGEFVTKKGRFDYISWSDVWAMLKNTYPQATQSSTEWSGTDVLWYPDGTGTVEVTIRIGEEVSGSSRLPITDNRNKPIQNPSADQINTSRQRCLAKAAAMLGLGLSVYQGEDLRDLGEPEDAVEFLDQKSLKELYHLARERAAHLKLSGSGVPRLVCEQSVSSLGYSAGSEVPASRYQDLAKAISEWVVSDDSQGEF